MGIDLHNLNFLAHAQDLGTSYRRTLAVGRQALFVEDTDLQRLRAARGLPALIEPVRDAGAPRYFEPLLQQWFGAEVADAVDASPYEHARLIHDMNLPWAADAERGSYDAVLDFGCLEHVFDFPVAWANCIGLCRVGGHILHALPANNLSGHGFYQFSPELFFNFYRPARGFALKALYFALKVDGRHWWRVANPLDVRRRVNLRNGQEVYMLVLAQKLADLGPLPAPQQSDYARDEWLRADATTAPVSTPAAWRGLAGGALRDAARRGRARWRGWTASGLSLPAPDYVRLRVADLLHRPPTP